MWRNKKKEKEAYVDIKQEFYKKYRNQQVVDKHVGIIHVKKTFKNARKNEKNRY
jgi:hypothetical protein